MAYHGPPLAKLKGPARAKRIKQLLANPDTRHLVPTANLPAAQRQERLKNAYLNAPVAPGSSETNRMLAHERENAIALQYQPAEKQIADERLQARGTQAAIDQWYNDYLNTLQGLRSSEQGRYDTVNQQVQGLGRTQGDLAVADASRVANQMANDAAARGAQTDTALGGQALQAATANQSLNNQWGALLASQGLANDSYAAGRIGTTKQGQVEAHLKALADAGKIDTEAMQLAQQKGQARSKYMTDALQRERQYGLNAQHAQAEAKIAGVKQDATDAQQRLDYLKAGLDPNTGQPVPGIFNRLHPKKTPKAPSAADKKAEVSIKYFQKHGYWPPTGPPKGSKANPNKPPKEGAGSVNAKQAIISAKALMDAYKAKGASRAQAVKLMQARHPEYGPVTVSSAADLAYLNGRLSKKNIGRLKTGNVRVPTDWLT